MFGTLSIAIRLLVRDWRAGELRMLLAAIVLAVASMTAVTFFTDRIRLVMEQQASELLAADLVIASSEPITGDFLSKAEADRLDSAQTMSFRSVVLAKGRPHLVEVKAVSQDYPLRGSLRVAHQSFAADAITHDSPEVGELWVDERFLQTASAAIGDRVQLGRREFLLERVLTYEPDRGGDMFSIAPRILMNIDDVVSTRLVQAGSRVAYRLLLAGEQPDIDRYRSWVEPRLGRGQQVLGLEDGRPELRTALKRARQFLGLAAMVAVLLAAVAVAMAARRYARRHLDGSAIMRCLGATQRKISALYLSQLSLIGIVASSLGCAMGYFLQMLLARILSGVLAEDLPDPSLQPALIGIPAGMLVLFAFALPPIMALRHVPPARVLRRELIPLPPSLFLVYGLGLASMALLLWWQAQDALLLLYVMAGTMATLLALALTASIFIKLLGRLRGQVGVAWRFGLASIGRRSRTSIVQVVALGLGIMVLLLLSLVRSDMLAGWEKTIPVDAPNHFLINVQAEQASGVEHLLQEQGIEVSGVYPMVRARLMKVNDREISPNDYPDDRAQRLAFREFNLSWSSELQVDNRIVAGEWWRQEDIGRPLISFEEGLAKTLRVQLGDKLEFLVAGTVLEVTVNNIRSVEWDSFNVNFFTVLPPGVLEDYPATYITSFYLPGDKKHILSSVVRQYPNITIIDVDIIMSKVRNIMDNLNMALRYVFAFTLVAGVVVLYTAIQNTQDERFYESSVLRTLGARRRQLWSGLAAEFVTLGFLSGLIAGLFATIIAWVLATQVFHFQYQFNIWIWLVALLIGSVGVGLAGLLGTRAVLNRPPMQALRENI